MLLQFNRAGAAPQSVVGQRDEGRACARHSVTNRFATPAVWLLYGTVADLGLFKGGSMSCEFEATPS